MSEENQENKDKEINIEEILKNEAVVAEIKRLTDEKVALELAGIKKNRDDALQEKKTAEEKLRNELLKNGNIDEISTNIRSERDKEWEGRFNPVKEENELLKNQLNEIKQSQKDSKLNTLALKELTGFNLHQASIEDAQEKFRSSFDFDDKGNLKHKQDKLNDQNKPFTAVDFYNELQKTKPHWFNGVSGAGVVTLQQLAGAKGKDLTAEEINKMTRAEYADAKRKGLIK